MSTFFRFPRTPHLAWLSAGRPRDDKVLSQEEAAELLAGEVVVEEKVDGANLGLSLDDQGDLRAQGRSHYLAEHAGQFVRLPAWLAIHGEDIRHALIAQSQQRLILFGEWCAARHSLEYTRLPDWFLLFDVFEASSGRFWNSNRRDALAARLGLATTPQLALGHFALIELTKKLERWPSQLRDGVVEGLIVRRQNAQCCELRAKLVRADFTQSIGEHWRNRRLAWNRLAAPASA